MHSRAPPLFLCLVIVARVIVWECDMGAVMCSDTQLALRVANLEEQRRFDSRFKASLPSTLAAEPHRHAGTTWWCWWRITRAANAMVIKYSSYPSRDVPYHVATSREVQVAEMLADFNERCARLVVGHA